MFTCVAHHPRLGYDPLVMGCPGKEAKNAFDRREMLKLGAAALATGDSG